jgi:hypothetical protein
MDLTEQTDVLLHTAFGNSEPEPVSRHLDEIRDLRTGETFLISDGQAVRAEVVCLAPM